MTGSGLSGKDKEVLTAIREVFPGVELVEFLPKGSTARVYHVRLPIPSDSASRVDRIIKVFRSPDELAQDFDPTQVFRDETAKLLSVCHTNVVSVYDAGYLKMSDGVQAPYYVMEFITGARDFDEWLKLNSEGLKRERVIQLLLQAARGIRALHEKEIIHCDLKFGNMLVGDSGELKIADLGFAKWCRNRDGKTGLYTTHQYFPRAYREFEQQLRDKRQMYVEIPRACIDASFDLHYLGPVIKQLLADPVVGPLLSRSDYKSFKLIIDRLDLDCDKPLLPKYRNAAQLIADLEKMQGLYLNRAGVEELSTYTGTQTIRIPISGSIPFTTRVAKLVHHPTFFRLNSAPQLGFTHYVFPGATHTRLEHSLGVYSNVSKYIGSLLADDHQPYFRQLVDDEMILTALLAGLLHDIGQHSCGHSLEDAGLTKSHETIAEMFITGKGIKRFFKSDQHRNPLAPAIKESWPEVKLDRLCWLITGVRRPGQTTGLGWEIVRAILSGPIDADKTDYLLRDAHHAGVEYAHNIDITRLMNSLSASLVEGRHFVEGVLAITWKGKQSAENIVFARSQMFWAMYWHHAVRSAHAMLAHACASHLKTLDGDGRLKFNDVLYWGAMGELIVYLESSESPRSRQLANWLRSRRLFKRAISLDYEEDMALYESLLKKKADCEKKDDHVLLALSRDIAAKISEAFGGRNSALTVTEDDVIVDIPNADKDRLGQIYVVEKGADVAVPYESRGLVGNSDDWQNRVRTVRVFVDPKIDANSREKIALEGRAILQGVL